MEFLDFLKYGAIGISLALAILSYRLLSKEQDKTEVRPAILNTIKIFFLLALILSVFFGATEILPSIIHPKESTSNQQINRIWDNYCSDYPDSTVMQKTERISVQLSEAKSDLAKMTDNYEDCLEELGQFDKGFYQNVIKLTNALKDDPDGWVNIAYDTENKGELINTLKEIFLRLGEDYTDLSAIEVANNWKNFKMSYSSETKKHTLIENSDITVIVRKYLDTFGG